MKKRIIEKRYKNRFRKVFAKTMTDATGIKFKPSRIKFRCEDAEGHHYLIGSCRGWSLRANFSCAEVAVNEN